MNLPPDIPPEAVPFLEEMGYLQADALKVGDPAPRLTLTRLETGEPVQIGADASLPTVLIFGSYT
jgi:hypothetical protein